VSHRPFDKSYNINSAEIVRIMTNTAKPSMLSNCAQTVRSGDRDRFLCAMFAPAQHREALFSLYAFNLEIARIRDSVTEPLIGQMRLQWWRDALFSMAQGTAPHHPVAEALSETLLNYDLTTSHLECLLESREADMTDEQPRDMASLMAYAEGTSAPLIHLSLEILGVLDTASHGVAKDVGVAWALTGLMRSLPMYAAVNKFFVPQDICHRAGIEVFEFVQQPVSDALREFILIVSNQARALITSARSHRNVIPRKAIPALLPATLAENYLSILKGANYDPYKARVNQLTPWGMLKLSINGFRGIY
jgi:phytoene synthase